MPQTLDAIIHADGSVMLVKPIRLQTSHRAVLTVLDEDETGSMTDREPALLAEAALGADWNRPEEDAAWAHLQPGR